MAPGSSPCRRRTRAARNSSLFESAQGFALLEIFRERLAVEIVRIVSERELDPGERLRRIGHVAAKLDQSSLSAPRVKQVAPGQVGLGKTRGLAQFEVFARRKKAFEVAVRRVELGFQLLVRQDRLHKASVKRKSGERYALLGPGQNRSEAHDPPEEQEIRTLAKLRDRSSRRVFV